MRRNRLGQLGRMALCVPLRPVGDPMARDANTTRPGLRPAETVQPPRYGHGPTGLTGRTAAHSEHPTTGLADPILGHGTPTRRQPRGYQYRSVVDGVHLWVSSASPRHSLVSGRMDASMDRPDGRHPFHPPRGDCDRE
ncbi:uncharacterized protein AKAW2_50170S [Aspergillus luchuensis]|uniref:Uncharacterized protein n=1 Tax=Aspergillus kawachii TaxID=1069201 RepID=A0A7R8A0I3_ASPKA|nr:uncharacterized protein AKAW2_50170S [Aspergillus luchuensis]BCR99827.1 hypothetical protein AKAW2_50170S [Aspergillus luchuensis]